MRGSWEVSLEIQNGDNWRSLEYQFDFYFLRALIKIVNQFSSVQLLSRVRLFATRWTAACQPSLSFTISQSLFKLISIESVMPSSHPILCGSRLPCPQSFPASGSFPVTRSLNYMTSQVALVVKNLPANSGDVKRCGVDP